MSFRKLFPQLSEPALLESIEKVGKIVALKQGDVLLEDGSYIRSIPFVLSGLVKVFHQDKDGNSLLMYYLMPGESCAMSMICCMSSQRSRIQAVAEEPTSILSIPVELMEDWMFKFPTWKNFVMETYSLRMDELLDTIDGIAFKNLDERLIHYLRKQVEAKGTRTLTITNQQIANELNSSREVISRLMTKMVEKGMVKVSRAQVEVILM
jgi:CRP/FNR family transcriptional regulator